MKILSKKQLLNSEENIKNYIESNIVGSILSVKRDISDLNLLDINKEKYNEVIFEDLDLKSLFKRRIGFDIFLPKEKFSNKLIVLSIPEQRNVRDGLLLSLSENNISQDDRLLSVMFGDTEDDIVVLYWRNIISQNEIEIIDNQDKREGVILFAADYFPYLKPMADALPYKRQILRKFDAHKVLTYLEAQVDLLSLIINNIIKNNPNIIIDSDLPLENIFNAINDSSVINIKSIESCLEEINTSKVELRSLQKLYIETKGDYWRE